MLGKIVKGWFISLFSSPLALLIVALALISLLFMLSSPFQAMQNFFGIETKSSLKQDLNIANRNNEKLQDVGKQDKADIKILEKTAVNVEEVVEKQQKATTKIKAQTEKRIADVHQAVDDIQKQPELSEEEKRQKVSFVRISAVWKTFCEFNESPQCPVDNTINPASAPGV